MTSSGPKPTSSSDVTKQIGVGLIGLGVVGGGVARALLERRDYFARQVGANLVVRKAAVRDLSRPRSVQLPPGILTTDVNEVLGDPAINIVVEVIGGEEPARGFIKAAFAAGKHVVTANKELIAKSGPELLKLAHRNGLDIMFEASVGGGIPIIAPLRRDLLANQITSIRAIINGTTNSMLTSMAREGIIAETLRQQGIEPIAAGGYGEALALAQKLGYAEPDPTNDVEGYDAAYKLAIMASLGFRTRVSPSNIHTKASRSSPGVTSSTHTNLATSSSSSRSLSSLMEASSPGFPRACSTRTSRWPTWTACSMRSRSSAT